MEKVKNWSKKKKIIAGVITLACVGVVAGGAVSVSASNKEKARMEKVYEDNKTKLEQLNTDLKATIDKENPEYLVKGVTKKQMEIFYNRKGQAVTLLTEGSNGKLTDEVNNVLDTYEKVANAFDRQEAVNSLYVQTDKEQAMNGKELKKDLAIADGLKQESVKNVRDLYFVKEAKTDYDKTINGFINTAEGQLKQIDKAKAEVGKVFKDNKVVSTDSKLYDSAKADVDKIKNAKAKTDLQTALDKVKAELDKKAEAEKAKQEADSVKQAEEAKAAEAEKAPKAPQTQAPDVNTTEGGTTNGANQTPPPVNDYTNNGGGYSDPSGGNTGGGYTPPATDNGGGTTAPPAPPATGGGNNVVVNPGDIQGSEENNTGGTNEWWGWDK